MGCGHMFVLLRRGVVQCGSVRASGSARITRVGSLIYAIIGAITKKYASTITPSTMR